MGDRIAVMSEGRLQQVGDPATVYEHPRNAFVAGFLGSPAMSFASFSVSRSNGSSELVNDTIRLRVGDAAAVPDTVLVGVRPEHTRPWKAGAEKMIGPLTGRTEYVEALGRETFVGVTVADGIRFTVQVDGEARIRLGESLQFGMRAGELHLFDHSTGLAIGRI